MRRAWRGSICWKFRLIVSTASASPNAAGSTACPPFSIIWNSCSRSAGRLRRKSTRRNLRASYPKNVRFYSHYYEFYRQGGFGPKFPCRHPSKLVSMKPDGSIHLPCAFMTLHQSQAPLKEIFESETAKKIIAQEETLWDFCKGCKIGCLYEVSAFINIPFLAIESGLNFLR